MANKTVLKGIDVASDMTGYAHALKAAGIQAVGLYLRSDRASRAMVDGLHDVGIETWAVYEKGQPISAAYFTKTQAVHDTFFALGSARVIGMPPSSHIFFAVDYNANPADVMAYFREAQRIVKAAGYLCSVYGSGWVCAALIAKGYAHSGWLAQSKGWAGYKGFLPRAAIVQGGETILHLGHIDGPIIPELGPTSHVRAFNVDYDEVRDLSVLW